MAALPARPKDHARNIAGNQTDIAPMSRTAREELDQMSRRLVGQPLADAQSIRTFCNCAEAALERFLEGYVALRKGQREFLGSLGIDGGGPNSRAIPHAESPRQLAETLFSQRADETPQLCEKLDEGFKEMLLNQVTLVSGMIAGLRRLMAEFDPAAIAKASGATAEGSPDYAAQWQAFEKLYRRLCERDEELFSECFSEQFRKASQALAGRDN